MAFLEPSTLIYGTAELPATLYGGLVYSNERIHREQDMVTDNNFIPLHNTALFRKRELLFPHSSAFATPICQLKGSDYRTEVNRLIRTQTDLYLKPEYHSTEQNRNLIAGEAISENTVRLWTVDDNSDRKTLKEFDVSFDFPLDFHRPIRANREENPLKDEKSVKLQAMALELRAYDQHEQSGKVFVRCINGLNLYESSTQEVSRLYNWPIKHFERIAYMDEVAIVNSEGLIFHGPIASREFSRIKADEKMISVATTDSPAELLMASKYGVFRADIRSHSSNTESIFNLNKENWKIVDPLSERAIEYVKDRERIWHVKCVHPETETYFVTTTKCIYVFDRRMPGLPLSYTNHLDFNGGEYCLTGGPFTHNELEMDVYQYFSLSRILAPSISHWAIGWNKRESVWTSMGPKCTVEAPIELVNLCRSQAYLPTLSDAVKENLPEVTRAIHYQQFPENLRPNENRAILFRQMDNGQIWFDSINFSKPKAYCSHEGIEKEVKEVRRSVDEIFDFLGEPDRLRHFWEFVDKSTLVSFKEQNKPQNYTKFMERVLDGENEWISIMDADFSNMELDNIDALLVGSETAKYEELQPPAVKPRSSRHLMSKIIVEMTEKAKLWMEDKIESYPNNQPFEQIEEEHEDYLGESSSNQQLNPFDSKHFETEKKEVKSIFD